MLSNKECVDYLKGLAKVLDYENKTHCQKLDICSREFGFNNFYDFKHNLPNLSSTRGEEITCKLMQRYCQIALPNPNIDYYAFTVYKSDFRQVSYFSHWIGWDKRGKEVREPSLINAELMVNSLRNSSRFTDPVYIVENEREFSIWRLSWYGTAFIPKDLAEENFRSCFDKEWRVCKNVNMKLVERQNAIELHRLRDSLAMR